MKVVYIFSTPNSASYILGRMILPQLEMGIHPVQVAGMFFFLDNNYVLVKKNPIGERLSKLLKEDRIGFIMGCDQCCMERNIENDLVEGAVIGCFPNLYKKAQELGVDQVITL
ncbi:MAG: sulfur reduction protein DsrE [Hydrogenobacter sp.]